MFKNRNGDIRILSLLMKPLLVEAAIEQLRKSITKVVLLPPEHIDQLLSTVFPATLKKKQLLLKEGDICDFTCFIARGCVRYFHNIDGEEHTGQFFFENAWYTDYESFLTGKPSAQNIEALEATDLLILKKTDLYALYDANPRLERFGRLMAEQAYLGARRRNESLTNQSPEERYLKLIQQRPKVFERIPQHYIASYLGIQPQSLSRIRKRLARK